MTKDEEAVPPSKSIPEENTRLEVPKKRAQKAMRNILGNMFPFLFHSEIYSTN
jgi:hypothetical protein